MMAIHVTARDCDGTKSRSTLKKDKTKEGRKGQTYVLSLQSIFSLIG
jgi:hypothetical protein